MMNGKIITERRRRIHYDSDIFSAKLILLEEKEATCSSALIEPDPI